jgi:hypothetical protein
MTKTRPAPRGARVAWHSDPDQIGTVLQLSANCVPTAFGSDGVDARDLLRRIEWAKDHRTWISVEYLDDLVEVVL